MSQALTVFDMASLLNSDEAISEYLSQVLADGDNEEFLRAIGHVVKARGMTQVARDSGMGRESLHRAFAPGAKPRFDTVLRVIHALGIDLCAQPGHVIDHTTH
ncbi:MULTISPECIES: addiction module antidote protein [unclassified Pseudomonas]|uniref:addiction module antidote protein n=1 Tax=unclassified Pseudomonas TaxID=196821 RepID=UPI000A1E6721|nr:MULTISPECIES: addiction module antidote protein [unclassified Pseudomonas]